MINQRQHILVVDDSQETTDMMRLLLQLHAYKVSTRNRFSSFMDELSSTKPDLVIMDKSLGWANGCDLCALIKKNPAFQHIPVVMISVYPNAKEECLFVGADAFVEKPFDIEELLYIIEQCISNT